VQSRFGGADRDAQDGRRFRQRHPEEEVQDDDRSPGRVEVPKRLVDELTVGQVGGDVVVARRMDRRKLDLDRPASPPTEDVDTRSHEQSVKPGIEPFRAAHPPQVPPGGDQGVLDRVSRELAIPEDEAGGRVQPAIASRTSTAKAS
jgi:hypothetical protein